MHSTIHLAIADQRTLRLRGCAAEHAIQMQIPSTRATIRHPASSLATGSQSAVFTAEGSPADIRDTTTSRVEVDVSPVPIIFPVTRAQRVFAVDRAL